MDLKNLSKIRFPNLETSTRIILLVVAVLLPLIYSPFTSLTLPFAKSIFFLVGVVIVFALFLIDVLKRGSIELPKSWFMLSLVAVPLAFLISLIFSPARGPSFIGYGFETGTFFFILSLFIFLFLTIYLFKNSKQVLLYYGLFAVSLVLLAIVYTVRHILGFNPFIADIIGPVGSWNDLAVIFSIGLVISFVSLEMLNLGKMFKVLSYAVFVLALLILGVVNFFITWLVLGALALIWLVYRLSYSASPTSSARKVSPHALVVLILSVVFILGGSQISNYVSSHLKISTLDFRPSWPLTIEVAKQTLKDSPVVGSGPNRFINEWLHFKPDVVNQTVFWNSDFVSGIGLVPTFVVTTGILGAVAFVLLFLSLIYFGFLSLFVKEVNPISKYLLTSSFLTTLLLWVLAVFYVPSITILVLTFLFTGIFFSTLIFSGVLGTKTLDFTKYPRISFVVTLVLVLLLILNITAGYISTQKAIASVYYQKSLNILNTSRDLVQAENLMLKAASFGRADIYLRALTQINISGLNDVILKAETGDVTQNQFQQVLRTAISNGKNSVSLDPTNYQNWLALGNVYAAIALIGVPGAEDRAIEAYEVARGKAPKNPAIPLIEARLKAQGGNIDTAREYIVEALKLKPNYTDAIFLLAQIEASAGNINEAINSVEVAVAIDPNNAGLYFQLGLLRYNNGSFAKAAEAFEQATVLVPEFSNAKYFLGLSYYQLDRAKDAEKQFAELKDLNPNNEEVASILDNLRSGKSPFSNTEPPLDDKPEDRVELPLSEESVRE